MTQSNLNDSHVLNNNGFNVVSGGNYQPSSSSNNIGTSAAGVSTVLSNLGATFNSNGLDNTYINYTDYDFANALHSGKFLDGTASTLKMSNVLGNYTNNVEFLPTEQVAKTEWNAATVGGYLDGATWKAPTLSGSASSYVLNTTDSGRFSTLTETITGSPFTTGNGAVSEALTFRGANNDTLAIKHNVSVANVPATTNNNSGAALDVRNESYAENYAKAGVSSNYAWNSSHKYAETNGNQSLNDAFAETYAYRDEKLTINSAVKTALADAAYINGAEQIVENRTANYSYDHKDTGSVKYVVTDTRVCPSSLVNLCQIACVSDNIIYSARN